MRIKASSFIPADLATSMSGAEAWLRKELPDAPIEHGIDATGQPMVSNVVVSDGIEIRSTFRGEHVPSGTRLNLEILMTASTFLGKVRLLTMLPARKMIVDETQDSLDSIAAEASATNN